MTKVPDQSLETWFVDKDGNIAICKEWWLVGRKDWTLADTAEFFRLIEAASETQAERGSVVQ